MVSSFPVLYDVSLSVCRDKCIQREQNLVCVCEGCTVSLLCKSANVCEEVYLETDELCV